MKFLKKNKKIKFLKILSILLSNNKKLKVKEKKYKYTIWPTVIPPVLFVLKKNI